MADGLTPVKAAISDCIADAEAHLFLQPSNIIGGPMGFSDDLLQVARCALRGRGAVWVCRLASLDGCAAAPKALQQCPGPWPPHLYPSAARTPRQWRLSPAPGARRGSCLVSAWGAAPFVPLLPHRTLRLCSGGAEGQHLALALPLHPCPAGYIPPVHVPTADRLPNLSDGAAVAAFSSLLCGVRSVGQHAFGQVPQTISGFLRGEVERANTRLAEAGSQLTVQVCTRPGCS